MRHQAEDFEQAELLKAYEAQEDEFTKRVRKVSVKEVPWGAHIIRSHTLYKTTLEVSGKLRLKAKIAPHGSEDSKKFELRTECPMCPPAGIKLVLTIETLKG